MAAAKGSRIFRSLVPPVGCPILPRLRAGTEDFDWSFGGAYRPYFVDSGTSALRLAITVASMANGRIDDNTWIPAYGCPDLLTACWAARTRPTLYDVGPTLPFFSGADAPTSATSAAVVCHFLGLRAPVDAMRRVLPAGCLLIEDSAQYFPPADGSYFEGDMVVLSFGKGKPVSLLEGGCLLASRSIQQEVDHVIASWPTQRPSLAGPLKRRIHDFVIEPRVYGLASRLPGLTPGRVAYRAPRLPTRLDLTFNRIASKAASGYQVESKWRLVQDRIRSRFPEFAPGFIDLSSLADPIGRCRLLRLPLLAPAKDDASRLVRDLNIRGLCATRMYGTTLPFIPGLPTQIAVSCTAASEFAERLVTIPINDAFLALP